MITRRAALEGGLAAATVTLLPHGVQANPSSTDLKAIVKGRYYWELLFNLDNTGNAAPLVENWKISRRKSVRKKEFLSSKFSVNQQYAYKNESSASLQFDGVTGSGNVSYSYHLDLASEIIRTSDAETQQDETVDLERTFNVAPNGKLTLYQLCYAADGMSCTTDTISTVPKDEVFVELNFTCTKHILGLNDTLTLFSHIFPEHDNKGEWETIRNSIVKYSDTTQSEALRKFIEVLRTITPRIHNQGEWAAIRSTCQEILDVWDSTQDKIALFKKLLTRFSVTVPESSNRGEWERIRSLSNAILSGMTELW